MYKFVLTLALSGGLISHAFGVSVSSPANGSTVGSSVHFVATAGSTSCAKGVASMGIYKAPYQLAYTVSGTKLDTYLNLSAGILYRERYAVGLLRRSCHQGGQLYRKRICHWQHQYRGQNVLQRAGEQRLVGTRRIAPGIRHVQQLRSGLAGL